MRNENMILFEAMGYISDAHLDAVLFRKAKKRKLRTGIMIALAAAAVLILSVAVYLLSRFFLSSRRESVFVQPDHADGGASVAERTDFNPVDVSGLSANETTQILPGLEPYFESFVLEPSTRNIKIASYYLKCEELLAPLIADGLHIVPAAGTVLVLGDPEDGVIFDDRIAPEDQWCLIGENSFIHDAYNIPLGSSDMEQFLTLSVRIPQDETELADPDCGAHIPVMYIAQFAKADILSDEDAVFIRGRLILLRDFEEYKIYEDADYLCYDITDFVYTDLDEHIDMVSANAPCYIDDGVRERVKKVRDYYRDPQIAEKLFYYVR